MLGKNAATERTLTALLVEDDPGFARLFADALSRGIGRLEVRVAATARDALATLAREPVDVVILDRGLPDDDGLVVVHTLRSGGRVVPTLLLTGNGTIQGAVEAMKAGVVDYLVKDTLAIEKAVRLVGTILAASPGPSRRCNGIAALIGGSAAMQVLRATIARCAGSSACALIEGETGAGKELVARALHAEGRRADGPFVAINCGALPEQLIESELFGHVRGAFTGALRDHPGLIEQAARGTLFLDEVEDLPLNLQGKILRLLQESEFRPLGSARVKHADVRVVAASNASLRDLVERRQFRRDLYYRLNVLGIEVPPLRERLEDLPDLVAHLRGRNERPPGAEPGAPSAEQLARMMRHSWPGNVRELCNVVERASVFGAALGAHAGWETALRNLEHGPPAGPPLIRPASPSADAPASSKELGPAAIEAADPAAERDELLRLLARHRWRREAAARELGISRVTLWRRMRRVGLGAAWSSDG
jgi:two-component system response regulator PilR (NtrC family)